MMFREFNGMIMAFAQGIACVMLRDFNLLTYVPAHDMKGCAFLCCWTDSNQRGYGHSLFHTGTFHINSPTFGKSGGMTS